METAISCFPLLFFKEKLMESLFFFDPALRIFIGILLGLLISLTGVGGGVLSVPILSFLFSFSPTAAVGTASFYVAMTKVYSAIEHARIKNINYKIAGIFFMGAFPTNVFFAGIINYVLQMEDPWFPITEIQNWIHIVILIILFFSIVIIFLQVFFFKKKSRKNKYISLAFWGFIIGAIMGVTGVGGGFLIISALLSVTTLSTKKVVGTSIFSGLLLAAINSFLYSRGGQVDYITAFYMMIGSFFGVCLASYLIHKISPFFLNCTIILTVIFSFFVMLFNCISL